MFQDTFYDHEDGNARNLKMSLTKGDRSPIHHQNWLQFDSKNQEFYGLPLERDKGRKEYQLVSVINLILTVSHVIYALNIIDYHRCAKIEVD